MIATVGGLAVVPAAAIVMLPDGVAEKTKLLTLEAEEFPVCI